MLAASWRQAAIGVVAVSIGRIDDGVDEEHIAFVIYQHIAVHGIENIVESIGIVFSLVFWVEAKAKELVVNFLFRSKTSIGNKRLYQYGADFAVSVLGKAQHIILTIRKILVVRLYALKER